MRLRDIVYPRSKKSILFICALLVTLQLTAFILNKDYWPFVIYDMYCEFSPDRASRRQYEGTLTSGEIIFLREGDYFLFKRKTETSLALYFTLKKDPARFRELMSVLKERYNKIAASKHQPQLKTLRVYLQEWSFTGQRLEIKRYEGKKLLAEL